MKNLLTYAFSLAALIHGLPACVDASTDDAPADENDPGDDLSDDKADGSAAAGVEDDKLNGQWIATIDGKKQSTDLVIDSWSAVGIRLHVDKDTIQLTRTGDHLAGTNVSLDIKANKAGVRDDQIDGTINGHTYHLDRDVGIKAPITLTFPADRPYRTWLQDTIMPLAQQDRESYKKFDGNTLMSFLTKAELYKHGSWLRQYMKGDTWNDQAASFRNMVYGVQGMEASPHSIVGNYRFSQAVQKNLKDPSKIGLALSSFGMYFSTAAGGALRIPMTSDSTAYFITDRPTRAALLGLVVMATPTHGPLASTFGRQLLDMGAMPATDDTTYARTVMELLAKSDNHSASSLSATGKSAITDWFAVMAIEDYRGVAFGNPELGWGYNMTNVQFYGLVTRALARPTQMDSTGKPVLGQVIVGNQLKPGDASYADVLNGGNDMQEYPDMSALKIQATNFLREKHPDVVAAVENAFATIVPKSQADWRAQQDIFHYITENLYDTRTANLTGTTADNAVRSVVALFDTLRTDSAAFETYILAHGYAKANDPAPKSTGF